MQGKYLCVVCTDMCKYELSINTKRVIRRTEFNMATEKVVLCGANAYEKKYYFNKEFDKIPESIKEELHIICVLFTEEVGGIFTICFDEDGSLELETDAAPEDYLYDEIGSGLLVRKIRDTKQELLQSLSLYYRVLFLHEDVSGLLAEE